MSTSISEVIESGGYDLSTKDGCEWLIAQEDEFDELLEKAEETIERLEAEALENCEHEDTYFEDIENTAEYELNQAQGNTSYPLTTTKIEICENCGKQRNLPEGDWENV